MINTTTEKIGMTPTFTHPFRNREKFKMICQTKQTST